MIRLGNTTTGKTKGMTYLWLVKDMSIYRSYSKKLCYVVMGWKKENGGWMTLFNGTLKQCREYMKGEEVVYNV